MTSTQEMNQKQRKIAGCTHPDPAQWSGHPHMRWCDQCGSIQVQGNVHSTPAPWELFPWVTPKQLQGRGRTPKQELQQRTLLPQEQP